MEYACSHTKMENKILLKLSIILLIHIIQQSGMQMISTNSIDLHKIQKAMEGNILRYVNTKKVGTQQARTRLFQHAPLPCTKTADASSVKKSN